MTKALNSTLRGLLLVVLFAAGPDLWAGEKTAADRGRDILISNPLNPPTWSRRAYDNAWKQWGLKEKPADYAAAVRERYGLHEAPFDNKGLPLGLLESRGLFGVGVVNNCLLCHAGTIAGHTIIGLGNASIDLQTLFEDLTAEDRLPLKVPFPFGVVRGTIDPVNPVTLLMSFRDAELNLVRPVDRGYTPNVASDPPAWWLLKRKRTRDWAGNLDARSARVDMINLLSPLNSADYIKKHEGAFADISAFLLTVEAPKYPFPIDHARAAAGKAVFEATCAKCHGTYGPDGTYPNRIVPFVTIGTDRTLANALRPALREAFNKTWFAQELGPDGQPFQATDPEGYQAPPLDGVWATAPYLHNGSAPTLYHVVHSAARPKIYTRSYRTGKEEYDTEKVGWKITVLNAPPDPKLPGPERRKVYDTTQPGRGNGGHAFGDKLTEAERMALLEYLKTL
jgi:mono/diheme cytochrome c family protein